MHAANAFKIGHDGIARQHRTHTFRGTGVNQVTGQQAIKRRGKLNQLADAQNQISRVGLLFHHTIHGKRKAKVSRVRDVIGRDKPGPQHAVGINRFAQAALLRATGGHVQTTAITSNMQVRVGPGDVATGLANHHHQFSLVVIAAIGML